MTASMTTRLRAAVPLLLDLVIPIAGYFLLHMLGMSDFWALTIAGSVTGLNALANTVRRRRLDTIGVLVVAELALTVVLTALTHDPRLVLARPALYLALAAAIALITCLVGRPLSYVGATPMATRGDPERMRAYERVWHRSPQFQRIHRLLTAVVGGTLLCYAVLRVVIIYSVPVVQAVVGQEMLGVAVLVALIVVIRTQVPRLRRLVDAELHAGDQQPSTASTALVA